MANFLKICLQANQNYQLVFTIGNGLFNFKSNVFIVEPGPAQARRRAKSVVQSRGKTNLHPASMCPFVLTSCRQDICDIRLPAQCSSMSPCRSPGLIQITNQQKPEFASRLIAAKQRRLLKRK